MERQFTAKNSPGGGGETAHLTGEATNLHLREARRRAAPGGTKFEINLTEERNHLESGLNLKKRPFNQNTMSWNGEKLPQKGRDFGKSSRKKKREKEEKEIILPYQKPVQRGKRGSLQS